MKSITLFHPKEFEGFICINGIGRLIGGAIHLLALFKKHTQSLFTNFAVAAVIYGMSLATSWLFQTPEHGLPPIWPASGVALSAMLLLGGSVWIGIFLPLCISSLVAGDPWLCTILSAHLNAMPTAFTT